MGLIQPMGARPAPRSDMLRRNAERMQREQLDRGEIRQLLTTYSGAETDEDGVDQFFEALGVETGALPPINVVLSALQSAGNNNPADVANQVRLYYRRARARPMPTPTPMPTPVGVS